MFLYQCMFVYNLFIFFSSYSQYILSHPVDVSHKTACIFTEAEREACVCMEVHKTPFKSLFYVRLGDWET